MNMEGFYSVAGLTISVIYRLIL